MGHVLPDSQAAALAADGAAVLATQLHARQLHLNQANRIQTCR